MGRLNLGSPDAKISQLLMFQTIMNQSVDSIYFKNDEFRFILVNKFKATRHGIEDPTEMIGKTDFDYFCQSDANRIQEIERSIFATGHAITGMIEKLTRLDGRDTYTSSAKYPLYDESGMIVGIWGISRDITEYELAKETLRESEERFRQLSEQSRTFTWEVDEQGLYTYMDHVSELILGYRSNELVSKMHFYDLTPEKEREVFKQAALAVFARKELFHNLENKTQAKDGHLVWLLTNGIPILNDDGTLRGYRGSDTDITERKQSEMALKSNRRQLTDIIDFLPDATLAIDQERRVIIWNKAIEKMTGIPASEMIGKGDQAYTIPFYGEARSNLMDFVFSNDEQIARLYPNLSREGDALTTEMFCPALYNNRGAWVFIKASPLHDQSGSVIGAIESVRDITERKKKEDEISYLSYHDQLTGLYNRRFYEEEMKRLDTKRNLPLTIAMGDVNGLKLINDSFGHLMGDRLLVKVSEVIKMGCRVDDIIARLGGDEFVILFPRTTTIEAERIISRIKDLCAKTTVGSMDISISFGCDTKNFKEEKIQDVLKKAEDHMYRHKLLESSVMRSKTIDVIMHTLYEKNHREQLHSIRVSEICEAIASLMNLVKDEVAQIRVAGLMHDIGKIEIDEEILNKPNSLNTGEWEEIKRHPEIGYRILSSVNEFSDIAEIVLAHQERWDGKGYPKGLKGNEISVPARIITIADAYDAMTTNRPYDQALSKEAAVNEMKKCSGTQFDPEIAKLFIERILEKATEQD